MATLRYSKKYDAYYNPHMLVWAEDKCGDPECEFCANRPERAEFNEDDRIRETD